MPRSSRGACESINDQRSGRSIRAGDVGNLTHSSPLGASRSAVGIRRLATEAGRMAEWTAEFEMVPPCVVPLVRGLRPWMAG
jgi:hypothetical protein